MNGGERTKIEKKLKAIRRSLRDKTEPRPPTAWDKLRYLANRERLTQGPILKHLKGSPQVVHGSRALNIHLPSHLRRRSQDWDIVVTREAQRNADIIEDKLDEALGSDMFYVDPHFSKAGKPKIIYRIQSRAEKKPLIDYVTLPELPPHLVIDSVKYAALKALRRDYQIVLTLPRMKKKWEKVRRDILRIDRAIEQMKWGENMQKMIHGLFK